MVEALTCPACYTLIEHRGDDVAADLWDHLEGEHKAKMVDAYRCDECREVYADAEQAESCCARRGL